MIRVLERVAGRVHLKLLLFTVYEQADQFCSEHSSEAPFLGLPLRLSASSAAGCVVKHIVYLQLADAKLTVNAEAEGGALRLVV